MVCRFLVNLQVKLTGTLGLHYEAWRTVPSDSSVLILRQHQQVDFGETLDQGA